MKKLDNNTGFTIVELLIATTVLSVILLLVTVMMLSIGNLFYKGVNVANVQDATRGIADDISKQLELSGQAPQYAVDPNNSQIQVYCIGDTRYSFVLNAQMGQPLYPSSSPTYPHVMWRDTDHGDCHPLPGNPITGADLTNPNLAQADAANKPEAELVPANSRLTAFCIGTFSAANDCQPATTPPYTISVSIAYGDNDLLCDSSATSPTVDCNSVPFTMHMKSILSNTPGSQAPFGDIICKTEQGDQFCATSQLTITVSNRL